MDRSFRHLTSVGISLGDRFEVVGREPFDGPVFLLFDGSGEVLAFEGRLASAMRAQVE